MDPRSEYLLHQTRRHFLRTSSLGLGGLALSSLLGEASGDIPRAASNANPLAPRNPHFTPKAKRVIYLHMSGGPPHLDLLDYKPELVKWNEKPCPDEFLKGRKFAFTSGVPKLMGTPRQFAQYGRNGIWMSDAIPKLQEVADELC